MLRHGDCIRFRMDAKAASDVDLSCHETEWALVSGRENSVRALAVLMVIVAALMVSSGKGELLLIVAGGALLGLLFFLGAGCVASGYAQSGCRQRRRPGC
jgi:hypothetical protein